jgi:hypothetical protein
VSLTPILIKNFGMFFSLIAGIFYVSLRLFDLSTLSRLHFYINILPRRFIKKIELSLSKIRYRQLQSVLRKTFRFRLLFIADRKKCKSSLLCSPSSPCRSSFFVRLSLSIRKYLKSYKSSILTITVCT